MSDAEKNGPGDSRAPEGSAAVSFTIVIPSRTLSNLLPCIGAIRRAGETAPVIVVWDAPKPGDRAIVDFMGIQATFRGMATVIQAPKAVHLRSGTATSASRRPARMLCC